MIRAALAPLLLAAAPALAAPEDGPRTRDYRYAIDWGPAALAEIDARVTVEDGVTQVSGALRSTGLGALFTSFEAAQSARHGPEGPVAFTSHGEVGDRQFARRVTWTETGPVSEALIESEAEEEEEPERTPIPDGALTDAVDPIFPILKAMASVEAGTGCAVEEVVYTGTSAFRLILTEIGPETLTADRDWTWGGEALRCRMRIERIGGFRVEGGRWDEDEEDVTRDLWFGRVDGAAAPVRMRVSWPLGYATGRIVLD